MSLLGLDVGTTGCKAIAFDDCGRVLARAHREYPLNNPQPGFWELDAERVWRDVKSSIIDVARQTAANPVRALAISALGEAIIAVGADGRPISGAPVAADFRARQETEYLEAQLGRDAIYAITGQPLSAFYSLPKIMWWKTNTPELYAQAWKFLCFGDYVLNRLGLHPVIDHSMAARMLAFDIHNRCWSDTILVAAGIPAEKLATPLVSGSIVGTIGTDIADELGLPKGVVAATGGFDQLCGALGANVVDEGIGYYSLGTTEALALILPATVPNLQDINVALCPHVSGAKMIALAGSQTGGRLLRWYRDEFASREQALADRQKRDVYDVLIDALPSEPTSLMVLPHFAGSGTLHNDPCSKGAILGLTFETKQIDLAKAILEGTTYEQAQCLDYMAEAGVYVEDLMVVGGGTRSPVLLQLKADITGRRVHRRGIADASCVGAAILAGCATGLYRDTAEAHRRIETEVVTFVPDERRHAIYADRLEIYDGLYNKLIGVGNALA